MILKSNTMKNETYNQRNIRGKFNAYTHNQ